VFLEIKETKMDEEIIAAWGEAVAGTLENPQAVASPSSRSIEADLSRGPPFRPSMYDCVSAFDIEHIDNDWRGTGTWRLAEPSRSGGLRSAALYFEYDAVQHRQNVSAFANLRRVRPVDASDRGAKSGKNRNFVGR
jgi:hypothetical protein